MFADDVVTFATSARKLQSLFSYVLDFCNREELTISEAKTKLMICGKDARLFKPGSCSQFAQYKFEVVSDFKYLGLHFDQEASTKHMITFIVDKARRVFFWLLRFVTTQKWNVPHTRLVLLNVYVRTLLQYGAPVWAPEHLDTSLTSEHHLLRSLFVQQRRCIRALLGVDSRLHNALLYAVSNQIPLQATLLKMVWRYYQRVDPMQTEADPANSYLALNQVARWTQQYADTRTFVVQAGK